MLSVRLREEGCVRGYLLVQQASRRTFVKSEALAMLVAGSAGQPGTCGSSRHGPQGLTRTAWNPCYSAEMIRTSKEMNLRDCEQSTAPATVFFPLTPHIVP